jgi:hypothetical protein
MPCLAHKISSTFPQVLVHREQKRWSNQLLNLNITDKITTKDIQKRQENLENQHHPPLSRECQSSGGGSSHHNPGGMDVS